MNKLDILVLGSGGREHAIIRKLAQSPLAGRIFCLPGNGGIAKDATCIPGSPLDKGAVLAACRENNIGFCVVTPDDPLAKGMVDHLEEHGIPCFGPGKAAAEIESSKSFAKELMRRNGIPTAEYEVFTDANAAREYISSRGRYPVVIKADGLALGKGVTIAKDEDEALEAVTSMMEEGRFGKAGSKVVVEEFLTGPEISVLAFTDGRTVKPMVSSMDHKRALDGDEGPNTGGMGAIAPNPCYTPELAERCMEEIFLPTIRAMAEMGRPFKGCLYFGLMATSDGPKVIEYNSRFGDPETQAVLPLMESDLLRAMLATRDGALSGTEVKFSSGSSCCVVMASPGYPGSYPKGAPLSIPDDTGCEVFVAGAKEEDGSLVTSGGRVLGVTATAPSLKEAIAKAYEGVSGIGFAGAHFRRDIGSRALSILNRRVRRIYVEKKEPWRGEAASIARDLESSLGIKAGVRVINRYDVAGLDDRLFEKTLPTVFSEPPVDDLLERLPNAGKAFAVCYLPGQFDQRARSAEECIGFIEPGADVKVKSAKVYVIEGASGEEMERIKKYLINPVEAMEDSLDEVDSLESEGTEPPMVPTIEGFTEKSDEEMAEMVDELSLAMDADDLKCLRDYFRSEGRDPSITEIRVCDTYWSDHCRHTTFLTSLEEVEFEDPEAGKAWEDYLAMRGELGRSERPRTLMDAATIGAKWLRRKGCSARIDESEEVNACSLEVEAKFEDLTTGDYLLMFKNETHNHPTEIEPFGGAATCIGGCIRDPLSGRAYVHQAMRITGSGDPTTPFAETLPGKLPQKKIAVTAAQGYSSYGNQIGLATGLVDEIYHPGYVAKHMELGAVVAAAPKANVRRSRPEPGDKVVLLGGRTGRDGIGGATGSSKSHKTTSIDTCSAEVQKGNAPEERKLQRLFRNPEASLLIKRCNDFGAGGVSVAIGELAPGLAINLDLVTKKYQGLDGTEIAISESQERMAVVVAPGDEGKFLALAASENLEATTVAEVTEDPRLVMKWRGRTIVDISRAFLDTNGAAKKTRARVAAPKPVKEDTATLKEALASLEHCSRQGLAERFDSTIGAGTVLMPFGGKRQKTPSNVMCALLPAEGKRSLTASLFAYGFDPYLTDADPYRGAFTNVVESVAKIVAAGGSRKGAALTLQEFFGKTAGDEEKWGRPLAALLGALEAQKELGTPAIGGKDSMSGTFENLDVPNTLVSFAINTIDSWKVITNDFKKAGSRVFLIKRGEGEGPAAYLDRAEEILRASRALSASTLPRGRVDVAIAKMCFGSNVGFRPNPDCPATAECWEIVFESDLWAPGAILIGATTFVPECFGESLDELLSAWEGTLEGVYPSHFESPGEARTITSETSPNRKGAAAGTAKPRVLIPVFPGTNCEYDTAQAFRDAGAESEVFVINNLTPGKLRESIEAFAGRVADSQILFIPGGFSGGDEPDGSGKFITAFLSNPAVKEEIENLLNKRDGLVGGICNGFQALVKLGLLPYGEFRSPRPDSPTLTFNTIGRHQSRLATTRVSSLLSPWLSNYQMGQLQMVPVSHGEGRFVATEEEIGELAANGQICLQYTTPDGLASMAGEHNPNGSAMAVEGICSPDGRVFGRMGHVERCQIGLYRNVEMSSSLPFFKGAVDWFR